MRYTGSCHCGKIAFEAEGAIDGALACNCSICSRKGSLLWFIPGSQFKLTTPEEDVSVYTFHKHAIQHRFCASCGIHPYAMGADPNGNRVAAVNLRCVDGLDLSAVPVQHYNGRDI